MRDQKQLITVVLGAGQERVGELIFEVTRDRQHSMFRYHEDWFNNPSKFPLTPAMPLTHGWTSFGGRDRFALPDALIDTTPDDWGRNVIQCHLGMGATELDILLGANDETRMGALRYIDEHGEIRSTDTPPVPLLPTLNDLRRWNEEFERGGPADRSRIASKLRGSGDSLGGARPKSAIYDGDVLAIAKYTSPRENLPVEQMEVATLNLAEEVGLLAASARIELPDSEQPVAIIRRFDRIGERRLHYISGHTFLARGDDQSPVFYTDLAETMRGNCGDSVHALKNIKELYNRVMFTILVSNNDDHVRNHGFLYDDALHRWRLSPAFDINPEPHRHKQLKTGISELSDFEPSIEALVEAAPFFEIETSDAAAKAFEMARSIQGGWRDCCRTVGMPDDMITNYTPAFEHPEMNVALGLGSTRVSTIEPVAREDRKKKRVRVVVASNKTTL